MAKQVDTGVKGQEPQMDMIMRVKELLADRKHHISLHDLVVKELRRVTAAMTGDSFTMEGRSSSSNKFADRLARYEEISKNLREIAACLAYWGDDIHRNILSMIHSRIIDTIEGKSESMDCLTLRWYPLILILYSTGISALAAKRYENLAAVFLTNVEDPDRVGRRIHLAHAIGKVVLDMNQSDRFKTIPGHERQLVPRSEYLFKLLQPELDDLLFLGRDYEDCFDQFEVFLALIYGYFDKQTEEQFWAPIGRFAYKRSSLDDNPFKRIQQEAESQRDEWLPIRTGLFPAKHDQFEEVNKELEQFISRCR